MTKIIETHCVLGKSPSAPAAATQHTLKDSINENIIGFLTWLTLINWVNYKIA